MPKEEKKSKMKDKKLKTKESFRLHNLQTRNFIGLPLRLLSAGTMFPAAILSSVIGIEDSWDRSLLIHTPQLSLKKNMECQKAFHSENK